MTFSDAIYHPQRVADAQNDGNQEGTCAVGMHTQLKRGAHMGRYNSSVHTLVCTGVEFDVQRRGVGREEGGLWLHHIKVESTARHRRRYWISRWGSRPFVMIKTHLRQKQIGFLTTPCNMPSFTRPHIHPLTHTKTCEGKAIQYFMQVIYQCHSASLYLAYLYNHTVYIRCICGLHRSSHWPWFAVCLTCCMEGI